MFWKWFINDKSDEMKKKKREKTFLKHGNYIIYGNYINNCLY